MRRITWNGARNRRAPRTCWSRRWREKRTGLLLLTATPQQLGPRATSPGCACSTRIATRISTQFLEEAEHYEQVAAAIDRLLDGQALSQGGPDAFRRKSERIRQAVRGARRGRREGARTAGLARCSMNSARAA